MACGGFICSRNTLVFLNFIYFCVGMMLIILAGYAKVVAVITTIPVMGGIIACGVFLAIIAVVGLIGAMKHHQVLLFFYMVILFLVFLFQFSIACASLALTDEQQQHFFQLGWKLASNELRQKTQHTFRCCGMDKEHQFNAFSPPEFRHPSCFEIFDQCKSDANVTSCCDDYSSITALSTTPSSIGTSNQSISSTTTTTTTTAPMPNCPVTSCWDVIEPRLHQLVRAVGAIGLFFSFTEIIGIWLTFRYRNQKDPRANPSAFL